MGVLDLLGQHQISLTSPHSLRRKDKTPQRLGCNRQACHCRGYTLIQTIAKQDDLLITVLPLDVDDDDSVGKAVQHLLASYTIPYLACRHVG
jgi:hypothetical protein